ncbi:hypothetical protein BJ138DRAFT_1192413 [Hygrophoropsis aurantiaca]|uniref:Uncharacterized protein n=1 Tax=Hygrophoropsis aurantiaca TaxID=72124 RepID=A0ACB7ZR56_9AGAM|nr:hypothetical protein BJ138DRAFT_1192413 [Hygrophoropsis aurantiaca]
MQAADVQDNNLPALPITPDSVEKLRIFIQQCYCRRWNPRNIEHPWYKVWNIALTAIFHPILPVAVAPQQALKLSHSYLRGELTRLLNPNDDGNLSDASAATAPVPAIDDAFSRFPDFAISTTCGHWTHDLPWHPLYQGFHTSHTDGEATPVLIEIKKYISRQIEPGTEDFDYELNDRLYDAKHDVYNQALCAFAWYPQLRSICAIVGSGPWWCFTVMTRDGNAELNREIDQFMRDPGPRKAPRYFFRGFNQPTMLDLADVRWRGIYRMVETFVAQLGN